MIEWNNRCILHIDLDAFYASVEQLDNPEYKDKPVIVGGQPTDRRAVVSTASYEARKFGVHSAMPTAKAYQLCPHGIYVYPRMKRYQEKSEEVMSIFSDFSPDIRQISVDEAFVDLSGTEKLFGNPSQTAHKIKDLVKEKTGLTVSIGLAQNRYIAKIASGLSKPNGFYEVPPGMEEEFMLQLPLEKVWGVGSKTLEHLHYAGFKTTKDVHSRSIQLLQSIFGQSAGEFLYNAVRGKEVETFSEAKSHTLSAETTFSYDINDRYALGTVLMDLSYTVMFRLMRHNLSSRTAGLKIRYSDFSTTTVQETLGNEILSAEELYDRVHSLFEKKYDVNRGGIRLLGVSVQNIGKSVEQQELFNAQAEKKRKVEQSILELQQKNPKLKVKKARLLDGKKYVFLALVTAALSLFTPKLRAETMNTTEVTGAGAIIFDESVLSTKESSSENDDVSSIFDYSINDKKVEFLADGYWESVISESIEGSLGFGNPLSLSLGTPVFSQKVDLTLWFMLDETWYFEAAFADGFEKNTVAAGFYGDGYLKEARLANRGITFPSTYSIDNVNRGIGGGNNQAPGVSLHFEDDSWKGDFAFRYDMIESHDKTYYGYNSVNENSLGLNSYLTGQIYVLPDDSSFISDISAVYVESSSGSYTDLQGRKYKRLSSSEYLLFPTRRQIILSSDAGANVKNGVVPAVAVSYSSSSTYSAVQSALGNFGTVSADIITGASGFLGEIQTFFGQAADYDDSVKRPNVSSFSYGGLSSSGYQSGSHPVPDKTGTKTDGFFTYIGGTSGTKVLLLQHPAGFSPFAAAFRYDAGTSAIEEAVVASNSTFTESNLYSATVSDDVTFVSNDFFNETHNYVDVYAATVSSSASNAAVNPAVRYPLADTSPGTYLGYSPTSDLCIRLRSYSSATRFDIGTDAIPGTIRFYKNGIIDGNAKFDSESGTVTPSSTISSSDRVYITWYEDGTSSDNGAITAAAGFQKQFNEKLNADLSFSTRWSYNPSKDFADSTTSTPGFATIATGLKYKVENFSVSNTAAVTVESDNVTGTYRILGMDDESPSTIYLTQSSGNDLPNDFVPQLNGRPADSTTQVQPTLLADYNGSRGAEDGSQDTEISGYKIPVSWNFSSWKGDPVCAWAATAINLGSSGSSLASATEFSIAIKPDDISITDYDVYLQLGVDSDEDFTVEDSGSVPTWKISDSTSNDVLKPFVPTNSTFATNIVQIRLTDEDRARMTVNTDARIIVVVNATSTGSGSGNSITDINKLGTIWVGPYEVQTQGVFTAQIDDLSVTTSQTTSNLTDVSKFNEDTNYVQNVNWKNTGTVASQNVEDLGIVISRYFSQIDLTPYKDINLYFKYEIDSTTDTTTDDTNTAFSFVLDSDATGISTEGELAIKLELFERDFKSYTDDRWHKLTIDRINKTVKIDNDSITPKRLYIDADVVPIRVKMAVSTASDSKAITKGCFSFDELHLTGAKEHYLLEDTIATTYQKKGEILSVKGFTLLENFSLSAEGSASSTIQKVDTSANEQNLSGNTSAEVTFATLKLSGDIGHSSDSDSKVSNAGHKVETTTPILGLISASEEYRYNDVEETLNKKNSTSINLNKIYLPINIAASTESSINSWAITQNTQANSTLSLASNKVAYTLTGKAQVSQKLLPSSTDVDKIETNTYQQGWADSTDIAFSTGKSNASQRIVLADISNGFRLPFANFAPQAGFSTQGKYTSSTSTLFTDSSKITTSFPFSIGSNTITFAWTKEAGGVSQTTKGGNYNTDAETLSETLQNRSFFFSATPFYDMFSSTLADEVLKDTNLNEDSTESLYYSTNYSLTWRHPIFGTEKDLFIPASLSLSAARDIRTSENVSDIYQYKTTLNFTAFNIFAKTGSLFQTNWITQDEYVTSLSATAKVPRGSGDNKYVYTGYIQANFYYNETDSIRTGTDISFETLETWSTRATVIWKRKGQTSPILGFINLFNPDYDTTGVDITRTDSINFGVSQTESSSTTNSTIIKKQSFELNHAVNLKMNKNFSLSSALKETYNCTWDEIILLTISASIGAKVEF